VGEYGKDCQIVIRDVLLSGVVIAAGCDIAENPSFVPRGPIFKWDWIWLRKMLIQGRVKQQIAHELRVLVSEILLRSRSELGA
jgi:hypothetical protein